MNILLSFSFGLLIGSFLNVVIYRLPVRLKHYWAGGGVNDAPPGILWPASYCPRCKISLRWHDNVPVLGWLKRRGRCHGCRGSIALRYPLIELLTAISFGIVAGQMGVGIIGASAMALSAWLIALAAIDQAHFILPDCLTLTGLWAGLIFAVGPGPLTPTEAIIGSAFGYLILWSMNALHHLLTGEFGMGNGDFKLLAMLGAWQGPWALPFILMLAASGGAVVAITRIALGKAGRKDPMPFGPWLAGAGWIALVSNNSRSFFPF